MPELPDSSGSSINLQAKCVFENDSMAPERSRHFTYFHKISCHIMESVGLVGLTNSYGRAAKVKHLIFSDENPTAISSAMHSKSLLNWQLPTLQAPTPAILFVSEVCLGSLKKVSQPGFE